MSPKSLAITLSLTGAVAAFACVILTGGKDDAAPSAVPAAKPRAESRAPRLPAQQGPAAIDDAVASSAHPLSSVNDSAFPVPRPAPASIVEPPLSPEARAAKVEQEATHDLRRLVGLLDLSGPQQDQVFQTLAKHSRHWSPGMMVETVNDASTTGGSRSKAASGFANAVTDATDTLKTPALPATDSSLEDALSEILAILDPEQQTTLLKDEMDRLAWWAEVLPQITPADDLPTVDAGEEKMYEGSDVLE